MSDSLSVCIFARAPVAGQCKTRLAVSTGDEAAAMIQARLTKLAIHTAKTASVGPVELWCAPDATHPFFEQCQKQFDVSLHNQQGDDLGARMQHTLALRQPAIIIGTDCPALRPEHLQAAATALAEGNDVALYPAEDGGYVLIGATVSSEMLFRDIAWGTSSVLETTRTRADALVLDLWEGDTLWDVDHPADLDRARQAGFNI